MNECSEKVVSIEFSLEMAAMLLQMYCGHFNKSGIIETPAARVVGLRALEPEVPE